MLRYLIISRQALIVSQKNLKIISNNENSLSGKGQELRNYD
jgi:hypothetical protein